MFPYARPIYFLWAFDRCKVLLDAIQSVSYTHLVLSLVVGFLAAFISGCVACKWMINIVKKGKLIYFAIYCAIAGAVTIRCV